MDLQIFLLLGQDGVTSGAIYALLALALVLVFAVTRVIFIPQGEFVAYGALTLAALQANKVPGTVWLLLALGTAVALIDGIRLLREGRFRKLPPLLIFNIGMPLAGAGALLVVPPAQLPLWAQVIVAMLLVVPMGPMIYRIAFQPLASASVLVLLIVSVAVHLALIGLGLLFFGAEGSRTPAFTDISFELAGAPLQGQTVLIVVASALLIIGLYFFFERTIYGKALRATAMNRTGARLMGIPPALAGKLCFTLAAAIGVFSGILIAPITTLYYDSGFLIGLKGFVGAIIGGLASYPVAAARRDPGRPARILFFLLCQRLQGSDRVYADHPGPALALADDAPCRGRRRTHRRGEYRFPAGSGQAALAAPPAAGRLRRPAGGRAACPA